MIRAQDGSAAHLRKFGIVHEELEQPLLASLFPGDEAAAQQVALGNWQNDFNQISLALPYLNAIPGVNMDPRDCFEIGRVMAEDKFGAKAASQMSRERFGEYQETQHFDNPSKPGAPLGKKPIPGYIAANIVVLQDMFRAAVERGRGGSANLPVARELLGSALHALEDFFAHTNFVEIALAGTGGPLLREHLRGCHPLRSVPAGFRRL